VFPVIAALPDKVTVLFNTETCEIDPNEAEPGKRTVLVTVDEVALEKKLGVVLVLDSDVGTMSTSLEIPRFRDANEHFD
jgi:hypothetical protein